MTLVFGFIGAMVGFALIVDKLIGSEDKAIEAEFWALVGRWND